MTRGYDSFTTTPIEYDVPITDKAQRAICKLIMTECANYDPLYEYATCLPRDLRCYMLGEHYDGWLCPYFEKAILPLDNELMNLFFPQDMKPCKWCGKPFPINGKQMYCSEKCTEEARKKSKADWMREHRGECGHLPQKDP